MHATNVMRQCWHLGNGIFAVAEANRLKRSNFLQYQEHSAVWNSKKIKPSYRQSKA